MARQPLQEVFQVGEWIDLMAPAAAHQAIQRRRSPAATVTPDEQVVLATDGLRTQTPLRDIVVDAQLAIAGVGLEVLPLGLCIRDGLADRTLGQGLVVLLVQPGERNKPGATRPPLRPD